MNATELATALPDIKIRLLIISDTHGMEFNPEDEPVKRAGVAIHCGDLTDGSKLDEFRTAIRLLKDIDAPLKLVIAGNHDFTMDIPAFKKKVAEAAPPLDPDLVVEEYGAHGKARQLFEEMKDTGLVFLDEGNHRFTLKNGAQLTVYASPWTPALGAWGFQYRPVRGHNFSIGKGVDVVVTSGPQRASWTTPTVEKGQDVRISLQLLLEPDRSCTALGISTKVGARRRLLRDIILARIHPISLISTMKGPLWSKSWQA